MWRFWGYCSTVSLPSVLSISDSSSPPLPLFPPPPPFAGVTSNNLKQTFFFLVRLKSSLEEALASNREQASDIAKVQDELRKTRSSLQVVLFPSCIVFTFFQLLLLILTYYPEEQVLWRFRLVSLEASV